MTNTVKTRGRPSTVANSRQIASIVAQVAEGQSVSRYIALKLVDAGYLQIETVNHQGRGRPQHRYVVAGRGRSLMNLAKNWG